MISFHLVSEIGSHAHTEAQLIFFWLSRSAEGAAPAKTECSVSQW